jgi:hypothetical protein
MPVVIDSPLPDLTLEEKSLLVVETGDNAVIITQLVIHFAQDTPPELLALPAVPVLLAYEPTGVVDPGPVVT